MMGEQLQCGGRYLSRDIPQVMGILNVTPDSFSDGGRFVGAEGLDKQRLLAQAREMVACGATILDIGGESTRPGAEVVSVAEELDRVIPAVAAITAELDVVVSVDTSAAVVMREAASAGAGLINDVRALSREGALSAAADTGLPVCLMHMQGQPGTMQLNPEYDDVVSEVKRYFLQRIAACEEAGIAAERLILDPGIGFGKSLEHNLSLLNRLSELAPLGLPLLVGTSRKSMIGQILGRPVDDRLFGSLASVAVAVVKGAWIVRVHDVAATADVVKVSHAITHECMPAVKGI